MANVQLIEAVHGADKKPRTTQQWEEIARLNTQKITHAGSNVPLAWVLVHGKNIPPNAIIAGEDRRRPLFIARTFWEGGVLIGQAGQHLDRGATFAYNGREIQVDTYEVLVPLMQTIRYSISDSYSLPAIPRIARFDDTPVDATLVQKLRAVQIVMVIDDSMSMAGLLWSQARSALIGLISLIEQDFNAKGIDLCFLNNPTFESNVKDRHRIQRVFDSVNPEGTTPTGQKLGELFEKYLPLVEDPLPDTRPIIVVVITDGVPTDDPTPVIINAARRLDRKDVPRHRFGISFVQIGNDEDAAEYLRELDDDIGPQHGCRDMVDTTPYDPNVPDFTRETLLKCILGAIDPFYDGMVNLNSPSEKFLYTPSMPSILSPLPAASILSPPMPPPMPMARTN